MAQVPFIAAGSLLSVSWELKEGQGLAWVARPLHTHYHPVAQNPDMTLIFCQAHSPCLDPVMLGSSLLPGSGDQSC